METMLYALASIGAAGWVAFVASRLCLAQVRLDMVRSQRRKDRGG